MVGRESVSRAELVLAVLERCELNYGESCKETHVASDGLEEDLLAVPPRADWHGPRFSCFARHDRAFVVEVLLHPVIWVLIRADCHRCVAEWAFTSKREY